MLHRSRIVLLLMLLPGAHPAAGAPLKYYLPADVPYNPRIPSPQEFFGFEMGDRHVQHYQLVEYMREIAERSPRVTMQQYARTYNGRPLVLMTITSRRNHRSIESIEHLHRQLARPESADASRGEDLPAVVNLGYSVHGDEASAGNAAPIVLYHLAAADDAATASLLEDLVVLLDPCLNPDGFDRFANWANRFRGNVPNPDPVHAEHHQPWPGGRGNFYYFDLNRDWLTAQHPESQGRLAVFHQWKPDLVLDFHEMSPQATFFFQPGIRARKNPLIPHTNLELTQKLAAFHVEALDRIGSLYFTEEVFDDFYLGKGSTYPDLHGAVGVLFEQASSRGRVQENSLGNLDFSYTIRNQVATSLSSLRGARELKSDLLRFKRDFYAQALAEARESPTTYYAFTAAGDRARLRGFADLLRRHDIECYWLGEDRNFKDRPFKAQHTLLVPSVQPEYRFLRALLERRVEFEESVFYDVSAWTLPLAMDLEQVELQEPIETQLLKQVEDNQSVALAFDDADYAYVLDWRSSDAPRFLYRLLEDEIKVRVAGESFAIDGDDQQVQLDPGSLLVPIGIQTAEREAIRHILADAAAAGVVVHPVRTGLTPQGIDLGSSNFQTVEKPSVLLVIDGGVSRYAAGETWHLLDQRLAMPVTLVPQDRLASVDWTDYTVVILPTGSYSVVNPQVAEELGRWVARGGTLVASGEAISWLASQNLVTVRLRNDERADTTDSKSSEQSQASTTRDSSGEQSPAEFVPQPYIQARRDQALQLISGAIFASRVDRTHPIGYGLSDNSLPLFRNHQVIMEPSSNAYSNPVVCTKEPLLAGYCSPENQALVAGSASVSVRGSKQGRYILMAEDVNFRAFWPATSRLLVNAIFFGPMIEEP